ncbi:MAG: hypothetical protein M3R69_08645 [Acidobacteriota bacterium]|nr:hypothetical protein [Acidobacteriota bacterium]
MNTKVLCIMVFISTILIFGGTHYAAGSEFQSETIKKGASASPVRGTPQARTARLIPGQSVTDALRPGKSRDYLLSVTEGQYAEMRLEERPLNINLQLLTLDGAPTDVPGSDKIVSFTAERTATYKLRVERSPDDSKKTPLRFHLTYTSTFIVPAGSSLAETKRINDYVIRIYKGRDEHPGAFVILKNGRRVYAKTDRGDFSFNMISDENDKVSADLVKPGRDITRSGLPGLLIGEYTGGAHCCFVLYIFELGPTFHIIPSLDIGNGEGIRAKRLGGGDGVAIVTNDDTFAYWNTDYADSPQPEVILRYRDGAYRPDFELMRKAAPSWNDLSAAAKEDRASLAATANEPYPPKDSTSFLPAFWGRMLDLIYAGHEDLAWRYFDEVWPPQKRGKDLFARDFKKQLSESRYWSRRK